MKEELWAQVGNDGSYPRLSRLLNLMQLLSSGLQWTADELSKLLGVSCRTVLRDIQTLQGAGVPLTYDSAAQKYQFQKVANHGFELNMPEILSSAITLAGTKGNTVLEKAANLFEMEYTTRLNPTARTLFQSAIEWLSNQRTVPPEMVLSSQVQTLFEGYIARTKVRISYRASNREPQLTLLSPLALVLTDDGLEISGWSSLDRKIVQLDVNRIDAAEATTDDFLFSDHSLSE